MNRNKNERINMEVSEYEMVRMSSM